MWRCLEISEILPVCSAGAISYHFCWEKIKKKLPFFKTDGGGAELWEFSF